MSDTGEVRQPPGASDPQVVHDAGAARDAEPVGGAEPQRGGAEPVRRAEPVREAGVVRDDGVVGALRVPDWIREPAERTWREMPQLARVFLVLTLVDVLGRSVGLLAPRIEWASLTPLSLISAFLPHDLWIVLPVILLLRRPDASTATPWIFRGAVVLAVTELLAGSLSGLFGHETAGRATVATLVAAAGSIGLLVGWLVLARGLDALNPRESDQSSAGLANVVAGAVLVIAAFDLVAVLTSSPLAVGDAGLSQALALSSLAGLARLLAWAYLLWVVIRGLGDARRPPEATTTAAAGAVLASVVVLIVALLYRFFDLFGFDFGTPSGLREVLVVLDWLGRVIGPSLIVVAFGLGLAEPPIPYLPPGAPTGVPPTAAAGEPPPGGPAILPG